MKRHYTDRDIELFREKCAYARMAGAVGDIDTAREIMGWPKSSDKRRRTMNRAPEPKGDVAMLTFFAIVAIALAGAAIAMIAIAGCGS